MSEVLNASLHYHFQIEYSMLIFSKVPATGEGLTLVIQQELRWIGHVINLPEHRLPKRILSGNPLDDHRKVREQKKNVKTIIGN